MASSSPMLCHSQYLALFRGQILPWRARWRRNDVNSEHAHATLKFTTFLRGFARRVEDICRSDFTVLPIIRSVWYRFMTQENSFAGDHFRVRNYSTQEESAARHVQAMQKLWQALWHGHVGRGICRMPIAGDTSNFPSSVENLDMFARSFGG